MKKGILLDVDGTLWDAVKVIRQSWNDYVQQSVPEMTAEFTDQDIRGVLGKTMVEIEEILLAQLGQSRRQEVMDGLMEYEVAYMWEHGDDVYPNVAETLKTLKKEGYSLSIVSNCQKGYIEDFLHNSGVEDLIDGHVCFGDTGKSKDVSMRICMEKCGIDQALYVGDTKGDLDSSRKAKIPFVYASYGFGSVDPEKEKVAWIETFAQLPEAADRILGK